MQTDPLFAVQLSPHRAMNRQGIRWVVALAAGLAAIPGLTFFAMGAWPIVGLLGLDVALLHWALTRSLRDGDAFEVITLWPDHLDIRCVSAAGSETVHSFNPFFVRFLVERDSEDRVIGLRLVSRERQLEVGRFLNAEDKARFAVLFAPALARARG